MKTICAFVAPALAAVLLAACAGPLNMATSWRGKPESLLISVWGTTPHIFEMEDENKVLFYTDADPDDAARTYCYTRFYVNRAGIVYSATSQDSGNGCAVLTSAKLAP